MISSSFLHKNEIERKGHLDVIQVIWYIFQRTSLIFLFCVRALFLIFQNYDICHHFSTPPLTIGIIISENDDNCGPPLIGFPTVWLEFPETQFLLTRGDIVTIPLFSRLLRTLIYLCAFII